MARYKQIARKSVGSRSPRQIVAAIGNTASNQSGPIPPQPPTPSKESTAGSTRRASIQAACDSITRATHLHTIDRNQSSPADAGASARGKKIILKAYSNTGGRRQSASEAPEEEAEESPSSLFLTNDVADETAGNQPPAADDEADLLSRIEQISSSVSVLERSLGDRMTMIEESLKGISETMDTRSTYLGERLNKMDELLSEMAVHLGVRKSPEHVNDLARLENSRIRNSSTPLAPLVHPKTGSPIDNFPGTEAELCLLHRPVVDGLLAALDLKLESSDSLAQAKDYLRAAIGLPASFFTVAARLVNNQSKRRGTDGTDASAKRARQTEST